MDNISNKVSICGNCSRLFESGYDCPFCESDKLVDDIQTLKNQLEIEKVNSRRLQERIWRLTKQEVAKRKFAKIRSLVEST